jgi:hypothetical protein
MAERLSIKQSCLLSAAKDKFYVAGKVLLSSFCCAALFSAL